MARAYLDLAENALRPERWLGLLEDVFVEESARGQGLGATIVRHVVAEARRHGCCRLVAASRHERPVHELCRRLGFAEWGREFRLDFGAAVSDDQRAVATPVEHATPVPPIPQ